MSGAPQHPEVAVTLRCSHCQAELAGTCWSVTGIHHPVTFACPVCAEVDRQMLPGLLVKLVPRLPELPAQPPKV